MSGRNQHFIPRMLLRGFRSEKSSDRQVFVWAARRNGGIFQPNITGIAAKSDFYSGPAENDQPTLDDLITDYEGRLSGLIDQLRAVPHGVEAPSEVAAEVFSHLTTRIAGFRNLVGAFATEGLQRAGQLLADPDAMRSFSGLAGPEPTEMFLEQLRAKPLTDSERAMVADIPEDILGAVLYAVSREGFDETITPLLPQMGEVVTRLLADIPGQIAQHHKDSLTEDVVGRVQETQLREFNWTLEPAPEGGCLLPDCVALALNRAGDLHPWQIADRDDTLAVVLPLAADRLLVGRRTAETLVNLKGFNAAAAASSDDFFVAQTRLPEMESLRGSIRTKTNVFRTAMIDRALREYTAQHITPGETRDIEPPRRVGAYRLEMPKWPDRRRRRRGKELVRRIVDRMSRRLALERLAKITFSDRPAEVLMGLDPGDERLPPITNLPDDIVGASPIFVEKGKIYSHVVLHETVAEFLTDDDPDDIATALHAIVYQLAEVSAARRIDQALPRILLNIEGDEHFRRLLMPAMGPARAYHASLQSAGAGADATYEERFREDFMAALLATPERLQAGAAMGTPGVEMVILYQTALQCAEAIQYGAARLAGHCAGLGTSPFFDQDPIRAKLDEFKLLRWFEVYARDLAALWATPGNWTSHAPFLAFHRHTERLLWAMTLMPKMLPDGQTWLLQTPEAWR